MPCYALLCLALGITPGLAATHRLEEARCYASLVKSRSSSPLAVCMPGQSSMAAAVHPSCIYPAGSGTSPPGPVAYYYSMPLFRSVLLRDSIAPCYAALHCAALALSHVSAINLKPSIE
ncbi:hypothetical protein LX32DRAFT_135949 [Colletotrichum zoysiae]|uniref:Secreted protein n=1 Tax=Colletotrichum zoysiae TaxID=1216348 RepID=A0AAD9LVF5_9PEZI|nr:hypothetical protein LX32DRAFT_135949 [Colletotrichum zoysiae]